MMAHEEIQKRLTEDYENYIQFMEETSLNRALERISWLIFDSHLTQSEIAKEAKMNRQTIHKFAKGQRDIQAMKLETLQKLDKVAIKQMNL